MGGNVHEETIAPDGGVFAPNVGVFSTPGDARGLCVSGWVGVNNSLTTAREWERSWIWHPCLYTFTCYTLHSSKYFESTLRLNILMLFEIHDAFVEFCVQNMLLLCATVITLIKPDDLSLFWKWRMLPGTTGTWMHNLVWDKTNTQLSRCRWQM